MEKFYRPRFSGNARQSKHKRRTLARDTLAEELALHRVDVALRDAEPKAGGGFAGGRTRAEPAVAQEHLCPILLGAAGSLVDDAELATRIRARSGLDRDHFPLGRKLHRV